jgi:hypothetical protein
MGLFNQAKLNTIFCLTLFGMIAVGLATAGTSGHQSNASNNLPILSINSVINWFRNLLGFGSQTGYPPSSGLQYSTSISTVSTTIPKNVINTTTIPRNTTTIPRNTTTMHTSTSTSTVTLFYYYINVSAYPNPSQPTGVLGSVVSFFRRLFGFSSVS